MSSSSLASLLINLPGVYALKLPEDFKKLLRTLRLA